MMWINIKHKRPELGIGVLIYLNGGFITVGYRHKIKEEYFWQLFGDTEMIVNSNDEVTHWMPLPEPPNTKL